MESWVPYKVAELSDEYCHLSNVISSRNCSINTNNESFAILGIDSVDIKKQLFQIKIQIDGHAVSTYVETEALRSWILDSTRLNIDALPSKYFFIALLEKTLKPFISYLASANVQINITEIGNSTLEKSSDLLCVNLSSNNKNNTQSAIRVFIDKEATPWLIEKIKQFPFRDSSIYSYLKLKVSFLKWEFSVPYMELLSLNIGDIILLETVNNEDAGTDVKIFIEDIELGAGKYEGGKVVVETITEIKTTKEEEPTVSANIESEATEVSDSEDTVAIDIDNEAVDEADGSEEATEDENNEDIDDTE